MKLKDICSLEKSYDQPGHHIKKQRHQFADRGPYTQSYDLSSRFFTYGCESWTIKKAECQRIDAFELWCWRRLLRVSWTARRSNQSILKEINPGRTDVEAETPILWLPDAKNWLTGKTLMLGKAEGKKRKRWQRMSWLVSNHQLNGHEFEQTQGDSEGQGSLMCCSPWGQKESDTT